jgi:hypothetical protein
MLFVLFLWIIVFLIAHRITSLIKNNPKNICLNLLKQGLVTLVLFNSFNISYSAGIHLKYFIGDDEN